MRTTLVTQFFCVVLVIASLSTFHSTAQIKEGSKISFVIEGQLKNLKKKAVVHLSWQEPWENREFLKVDVINGKFTIAGKASQPTLGNLRIITYNDSLKPEQQFPWECDRKEIFICNGKTSITGTDSLTTAKLVSGCNENRLLPRLDSALAEPTKEQENVTAALRNAYATKDTCGIKVLQKSFAIANYKLQRVYETFIMQYPSSYLSVNLLNAYVYQTEDKKALRFSLALLQRLSASLQSSPLALAIKERIDQRLYPVVGSTMQSVVLKDQEGVSTDIAKFKGKVLLIDFWASWCSPCRKEFPELLTLYEKYKDQGFEIIGISIDHKKDDWLKAIKKDGITWPQFIDEGPAYGGRAGKLYRVSAIPAKFLVNKDGLIVAEKVTTEQLEKKLTELLAN